MTTSEAVMFQFFGGVTVLWAVLLAIFAGNKRRLKLQMRSITTLQRRGPEAPWQAGRWDNDERHATSPTLRTTPLATSPSPRRDE